MAWTAKQYSYSSAYAWIQSNITVTHSGTNITVSATANMYSGGSTYSGITRYMCLVINGTTYYNCGSRSGSFSKETTYNSWISGSKTISVGHYGSGSVTVGVYISASSSSLSSSGTFIWNGKTSTKTSDCSLKTVSVSYGESATRVGQPTGVSITKYVKGGSNATISWNGAGTGLNNPVASYSIWYKFSTNNGSTWSGWTRWVTVSSSSRSYTGALSSLGYWQFCVTANNTITAFSNYDSAYVYCYTWSNVSNPSNFKPSGANLIGSNYYIISNIATTTSLSWTGASAGTNNSISYYTINGSNIGNVNSKSYSLSQGNSATYTLKTVGARGDTSSGVSCKVYNPKLTFSTNAPTLSASNVYTNSLTLTWTAATKSAADNLSIRYKVEKNTGGDNWSVVVSNLTTNSYNVTDTAQWGQKIKFRVVADLYYGTTVYRTFTTANSAEIMRGQLPENIQKIIFDNSWYANRKNTGWKYETDSSEFEPIEVLNIQNNTIDFIETLQNKKFTFGHRTKITIYLPENNTAASGGGEERLYVNGVLYTSFSSNRIVEIQEFDSRITTLTLKFVNVYTSTEVKNNDNNGEWIISNIRTPSALYISTMTDESPLLTDFGHFEFNTLLSVPGYIKRVILEDDSGPYIGPDASQNRNHGIYILTSTDQIHWRQVMLENGDAVCEKNIPGSVIIDEDCYQNGVLFPNYTSYAGETGTDSRQYQSLQFNIDLTKDRWIPYNGETSTIVDLKTLNTKIVPTTFYYKIIVANKYFLADGDNYETGQSNPYVAIFELDTSALLTFPSNPIFISTNAPEIQEISVPYASTTKFFSRVFNNGVKDKKSYLLFDFYPGFNSNQYYLNNSDNSRYVKINNQYYLLNRENDSCNYQITVYTCINSNPFTWQKKYEGINLSYYSTIPDNLPQYGYTSYTETIDEQTVCKYRGWYQLNLSNEKIDEFIRIGVRPYLTYNNVYNFPEQITNNESYINNNWLLIDSYNGNTKTSDIWLASTYAPNIIIKNVDRIDNQHLDITYQIAQQNTGSTYNFGYGDNIFLYNMTPSDQQLLVNFKIQPLQGSWSDNFAQQVHNLNTINANQQNNITLRNVGTISQLNDSQSYNLKTNAIIKGSQYDLSIDENTLLPIYNIK